MAQGPQPPPPPTSPLSWVKKKKLEKKEKLTGQAKQNRDPRLAQGLDLPLIINC